MSAMATTQTIVMIILRIRPTMLSANPAVVLWVALFFLAITMPMMERTKPMMPKTNAKTIPSIPRISEGICNGLSGAYAGPY